MTPEQKLKWAILTCANSWADQPAPEYPNDQIDELYDALVASDGHWDAREEVRCSGVSTGLPCELDRHFESSAVAMPMPDGAWVGWTHWYGGGKHAEPGAIEWMSEAYDVECAEEEKMVVVRTFSLPSEAQ